jgi:hypothetical protein
MYGTCQRPIGSHLNGRTTRLGTLAAPGFDQLHVKLIGYLKLSDLLGTPHTTRDPFWHRVFTSKERSAIEEHRQDNDRTGLNHMHNRPARRKLASLLC